MNQINFKEIGKLTLIFSGIYLLSFLGYLFPILSGITFWIIIFITLALTLKKLEYGVLIVLAELFIGAKGYLFSFNLFGFVLSLRIALFALVFLIWFFRKDKENKLKFVESKFFIPFAVLTIFLALGVIRGLYLGNAVKNIFFDANGYLYFAFIFPLFSVVQQKEFRNKLFHCLIAGGIALSLLTIYTSAEFSLIHPDLRPDMSGILSYEFSKEKKEAKEISHSVTPKEELKSFALKRNLKEQKPAIYRWTKDTGIGEIAFISSRFFRFFSSGQIYIVFVMAILFYLFTYEKKIKRKIILGSFFCPLFLAIIISFSRSLWFGFCAAFLFFLITLPWRKSLKILFTISCLLMILFILVNVFTPSVYQALTDRVYTIIHPTAQSTAVTRMNLLWPVLAKIKEHLFLGSGFGTIIKYESVVPGQAGTLKVFTFEWGYLDIFLKIGFLGLFAYLWLLWQMFKIKFSSSNLKREIVTSGIMAGVFGLIVTNTTTPYLNHPLGIGYLLIAMGLLFINSYCNLVKNK